MTEELRTYCRICEAACGLVVTPGDGARIVPDKEHPQSQGFVCAKGLRFLDVARHPSRLLAPQVRDASGRWRAASWTEAIGEASRGLRGVVDRHGPHAVGVYFGNPLAYNAMGAAALSLLTRSLGTRNVYCSGSQDCNNKFAGSGIVFGTPLVHPVPDFEHADLAILLGTNPLVSQSSFVHNQGGVRALDRMRERGGEFVFVDPRRTESAKRWGEHLPIRPRSDVWLLLALLALVARERSVGRADGWDELLTLSREVTPGIAAARTGIEAGAIERLARRILSAKRVAFHTSVGVNQGGYGTLAYVAVLALAQACGALEPGGGMVLSPYADLLRALLGWLPRSAPGAKSRVGGFASVMGTLPGGVLAEEMERPGEGQIRALLVVAGDPVRSIPGSSRLRRAISTLECVVSIDMFENATNEQAHVLLPATSWLERGDFAAMTALFQSDATLQTTGSVLPPPGEVREETEILVALLAALKPRSAASCAGRLLERAASALRGARGDGWGPPPALLGSAKYLPKRRLRFWSPELALEAARLRSEEEASSKFLLVTRRRRLGHNSWLHGGGRDGDGEEVAWLSPEDGAALGLGPESRLAIHGASASIEIAVQTNPSVACGVVVVPHGLAGANVNAILPSGEMHIERASGQLRMTGVPVTLEVIAPSGGVSAPDAGSQS